MKILYLDTETTGLDPVKNGIIQIAGIIEINNQIVNQFEYKIQPFSDDKISEEALKINGYNEDEFKTFERPTDVYNFILNIFNDCIDRYDKTDKFYFFGQKPKFDYDFLDQWFKKMGNHYLYAYIAKPYIDLGQLAVIYMYVKKIKFDNLRLKTIANYFNIEFKAHDAYADVMITRTLFHKIISELQEEGVKIEINKKNNYSR